MVFKSKNTIDRFDPNTSISSEQMYEIENIGHNKFGMKKLVMMENAGHSLADLIIKKFKKKLIKKKIIAVCGTGNNGGDAMVAMRHISGKYNMPISIILVGSPDSIKTEESRTNWNIVKKMKHTINIKICKNINDEIKKEINDADIIVDGIFGTGIKGEIKNLHAEIIKLINKSNAFTVSVDIPSGLDPNNGFVSTPCIRSDFTVTFHRIKHGLLKNKKYTGKILLESIGIPTEIEKEVL
ncbi:MAG: NAD(P)H-hydrate epimerase [Nitrososphaeraceae archaeon]